MATPIPVRRLLRRALAARRHAYAPYSHFAVGAALLTRSGRVFTGCNVENASFGLTLCAERAALAAAVAAGERRLVAVAVVAGGPAAPMPCGACRQALAEFGGPDLVVLAAAATTLDHPVRRPLKDLLPLPFQGP